MPVAIEDTLPPVADDAPFDRIDAAIAELREMNSDDWAVFEENDVGGSAAVRLEYTFSAPAEETANDVAEYLTAILEHDAVAVAPATDFDVWGVRGTTPEATVTEAGLAEWVRRLVALGYAYGDAELDGWTVLLG
jgi:hypothetical protein